MTAEGEVNFKHNMVAEGEVTNQENKRKLFPLIILLIALVIILLVVIVFVKTILDCLILF